MEIFGRVLRTGLLGKARARLRGLGPLGEYPSRKWSPIETAPSDVDVLIANRLGHVMWGVKSDGVWWHFDSSTSEPCREHQPTHWMSLPEAPDPLAGDVRKPL
jgi:hypothetical protein